MASVSTRHKQREETIKSLSDQVTSITWYIGDTEGDKMKFNDVDQVKGYYFSVDDDLAYPPDYVEKMLAKLQEYDNRIIVTAMGRIVDSTPIIRYYKSEHITKFSCLGETKEQWVHIGGTGCMAFHTDYFRPEYFGNGYMSDIWVALEAQKKQVPILCIAHPPLWIQQQETGDEGIYERYKDNDKEQVNAINSVDWKLYVKLNP